MNLQIDSVGTAKTGKSLRIKAGGEWYGAKLNSGIKAGTTIDAEIEDGQYGKWIVAYKQVNGAQAAQSTGASPSPAAPPNGGDHQGLTEAEMRFVSNCVGQAILAKTIDIPDQISRWAKAARMALKELA